MESLGPRLRTRAQRTCKIAIPLPVVSFGSDPGIRENVMVVEQGQTAPLPEQTFNDAEGAEHDLRQELESGPLLLGIYKSSCASSKQMFPFLERIHQRYGGQGLRVIGVSQDSENITRS